MPNQQLLDYIRQQTEKGVSADNIKQALLGAGWQGADIEEAFASMGSPEQAPIPGATAPAYAEVQTNGRFLGPVELLKKSWGIYKTRIWTLVGIFFVPVLIVIVSVMVFGSFFLLNKPAVGLDNLMTLLPMILIGLLVFVIAASVQFWCQIALLYAIKNHEEKIGIKESFRRAYPKIMPYWWVGLLEGLVVLGGFFFFIIPGWIFAVSLSLATYVLIAEDIGGMNALLKSKFYVQGHWWGVVGRILFFALVLIIPIAILSALPAVGGLISGVAQIFIAPFSLVYTFLIYKSLKDSKAGIEFKPAGKGWLIASAIFGLLAIPAFFFLSMLLVNSGSVSVANDAKTMSYMDQLKSTAAVYQMTSGGSYNGLSENSDYISLCEEINSNGSSCSAQIENDSYCVKAKLSNKIDANSSFSSYGQGDYWCVDSNGETKAINGADYCTASKPSCGTAN